MRKLPDIDTLYQEAANDLTYDAETYIDKLTLSLKHKIKWMEYYNVSNTRLKMLTEEQKVIKKELFHKYKHEYNVLIQKNDEVMLYVEADSVMQAIERKITYERNITDFCIGVVKTIDNLGWQMREFVQHYRWLNT